MEKPRKYYIKTLGCQANERDSQDIMGILEAFGFLPTTRYDKADLIILNSCSVRQKSEDKIYGFGKKVKDLCERGLFPTIILSGCMVGSATGDRKRFEIDYLKKKMPWVDYFINPAQIRELPKILKDCGLLRDMDSRTPSTFFPKITDTETAYVNISTGCDNFCTFCVVPYARGTEISRSKEDILKEVIRLSNLGYKHIYLVGQNVNSWGLSKEEKFKVRIGSTQKLPFADLIRCIHEMPQVEKISFISSNPFDFTQDLIDTLALPKVSKYLHMAVQSGDNNVLKRMNRRHTIEDFIKLVESIRKKVPTIEFGTDIIVGFPGETEEQFINTVNLCKAVKFNVAYISIYSARKGTAAAENFKDDISLREKRRRHNYLMNVIDSTRPDSPASLAKLKNDAKGGKK